MKASRKILLITGLAIAALLVTGLLALRKDLQEVIKQKALEERYQVIPVEDFDKLDFSANWSVRIWQGWEYKVEIAADGADTDMSTMLHHQDGNLYFKGDSTGKWSNLRAKVSMPKLRSIKAGRGTTINLQNAELDSLSIILEDAIFIGKENIIENILIETSGSSRIQWTDDPFQ